MDVYSIFEAFHSEVILFTIN